MKLSTLLVVFAACLLTHGVMARASQPQLGTFTQFMTDHQFFGAISDAFEDLGEDIEQGVGKVTGGIQDMAEDFKDWTEDQFNDAKKWVQENKGKINGLIDKGADVAIKSLIAGGTTYIRATADATKNGLGAAVKLSQGDWEGAADQAIKAGVGFNDARTKAFKAAAFAGLKGVGLAKAVVLIKKIEKKMKARKRALVKNLKSKILKNPKKKNAKTKKTKGTKKNTSQNKK